MNAPEQHGGGDGDPPAPQAGVARGRIDVPGYHVFHVTRRTPDADVYLAYHRPTQTFRDLIVVRRPPDATHDADATRDALRRSVEAEVSAASAVQHPGVAPVQEVGLTADGRLFVAAARPIGRTLREVLTEDGAVRPGRRAIDLGLTLADALTAAHERGVGHGWLSPDSVILVTGKGDDPERLVVLGTGTAAAQGAAAAPGTLPSELAPFTSPERAAGGPRTLRDDVFGLGAVIQTMLTGAPPPVVRAGGGDQSAPSPHPVAAVLQQARAADPTRRYTSAGEVAAALRAVGDLGVEQPSAASSAGQRVPPAALPTQRAATLPPPRTAGVPPAVGGRRRLALAAAGVLGLAALAGTTHAWRRRAELAGRSPAPAVPRPPERAASVQQVPLGPPVGPVASTTRPPAEPAPAPAALPSLTPPPPEPAPPQAAVASVTRPAVSPPPTAPRESRVAAADVATAPSHPVASTAAGRRAGSSAPTPAIATAAGEVAAERSASRAAESVAASPAAATAAAAPAGAAVGTAQGANLTGAYAALTEYLGAIEARDLDRLARAYPGMTEQQRRAWATFFGSVANFRPQLVVDDVTPAGATARAHVRGAYEYENLRPRRAERQPVSFNITLARDGAGWRVRTVE